jgi:hypothetical protein
VTLGHRLNTAINRRSFYNSLISFYIREEANLASRNIVPQDYNDVSAFSLDLGLSFWATETLLVPCCFWNLKMLV